MNVLEAYDIAKTYRGGDGSTLHILNGVNLAVKRGEMIAIVGESGAGKSTLLHVIGALDRPQGDLVAPRVKAVFRIWVLVFAIVGAQMGWVLRPFVGAPWSETHFFREGAWSNAYEVLAKMIGSILKGH